MTLLEVRSMLYRINQLYLRYRLARDTADAYRQQLSGSAVRYDSQGGGGCREHDSAFIQLAAYEEKAEKCRREWTDARSDLQAMCDRLPDEHQRAVIVYRYLNGYRFEAIAEALNWSTRKIYKLHKAGLKSLSDILENVQ